MQFLDYERAKNSYFKAQQWFEAALAEQERIITRTMPSAVNYSKPLVQNGSSANPLDEYVISKEEKKIEKRISKMRKLLDDRKTFLEIKERDVRASLDNLDKVYVMWRLDGMALNDIATSLKYSRSQVYRMTDTIKKVIRKDETK